MGLSLASRWPAFRHPNFRLFFAGQLASLVGTWMQSAAQLWLVYRLTGSASLLGMLGFAMQIPIFVLGPLAGLVCDTLDRRRVLLATQGLSMALAFLLAGLVLTGRVEVWHLLTICAVLGCVNAFDIPARQTFLTDMVGKDDLMNAVALNSSMFHAARMVGPALGGLVIAAAGEGWCFFANGLSFLAVLVSLLLIRVPPQAAPPSGGWRRLLEGLRYVVETPPVRAVLLLLGLVSLTGTPYSVLLPVFAREILHVDARGLGWLMAAGGVGSLTGALILASRPRPATLAVAIRRAAAIAGLSLVVLSQSRSFGLSAAALVGIGFGITTQLASTNTLLQIRVPDAVRGRVMSVYAMMFMGVMPIGALVGGAIAERIGAPLTVTAGGACCVLGAALFRATAAATSGSAGTPIPQTVEERPAG
jgi:predicted MFS family arabinose efflux permease